MQSPVSLTSTSSGRKLVTGRQNSDILGAAADDNQRSGDNFGFHPPSSLFLCPKTIFRILPRMRSCFFEKIICSHLQHAFCALILQNPRNPVACASRGTSFHNQMEPSCCKTPLRSGFCTPSRLIQEGTGPRVSEQLCWEPHWATVPGPFSRARPTCD